jgi:four helix bundle protein
LRRKDPKLYDQIRRAASSVALNLAEGSRRQGADRCHLWRIAAGSAAEVQAALRVAVAWGDVRASEVEDALRKLDRLLGLLWGLTR